MLTIASLDEGYSNHDHDHVDKARLLADVLDAVVQLVPVVAVTNRKAVGDSGPPHSLGEQHDRRVREVNR
jgi:hypothetical protein